MKQYHILWGVLLLALLSCSKHPGGDPVPTGKTARVSITLKGAHVHGATKAAPVAENEVLVSTVDAFVFNATGDLDAYGHYTAGDFTTTAGVTTLNDGRQLECTTGPDKKVYVIINGGRSGDDYGAAVTSEDVLKAQVFRLEDNARGTPKTLDHFQMIGSATQGFSPGDNTVSVEVRRCVARVWIKKITRSFDSPALTGDLVIRNIYMSNVAASFGYDGTPRNGNDEALWYNRYDPSAEPRRIAIDHDCDLWLNAGIESPYVVLPQPVASETGASSTAVESTFYVMPNQTGFEADEGGDAWTPRNTKLVVETEYGGKTYYYSIPIVEQAGYPRLPDADPAVDPAAHAAYEAQKESFKGLSPNYSYEIEELVLTRLGSSNPDEPVIPAMVNFDIAVRPWDVVALQTEDGKYVI